MVLCCPSACNIHDWGSPIRSPPVEQPQLNCILPRDDVHAASRELLMQMGKGSAERCEPAVMLELFLNHVFLAVTSSSIVR